LFFYFLFLFLMILLALHGYVYDRTAACYPGEGYSKENCEEGNGKPPRLFSLDMMPIDGCFEDVLQQWPLFFVVNFRLPSDGSH